MVALYALPTFFSANYEVNALAYALFSQKGQYKKRALMTDLFG